MPGVRHIRHWCSSEAYPAIEARIYGSNGRPNAIVVGVEYFMVKSASRGLASRFTGLGFVR
jgi:hypothetical protein